MIIKLVSFHDEQNSDGSGCFKCQYFSTSAQTATVTMGYGDPVIFANIDGDATGMQAVRYLGSSERAALQRKLTDLLNVERNVVVMRGESMDPKS